MSRLYRFSRQAFDLKTIHHHRRAAALPFLSSFSTSAAEAPAATDSKPEPPPYEPPPIGIALTKDVGRAAFASEQLAAGRVLHSARPVVAHPCLHMMNCVCYYCLRRLRKPDAGAEAPPTVTFCSEKCEHEAKKFYDVEKQVNWSKFHEYCREEGLKYPLLIKRFACQIIARNIPAGMFELLDEDNSPHKASMVKEDFALLRSTLEDADIKVEKKKEKDFPITDGEAKEAKDAEEPPLSFLTKEWYTDVLGRIHVNSFRVELPVQSHEDLQSAAAASVEGETVDVAASVEGETVDVAASVDCEAVGAAASVKGEAVGNAMYMLASFYNHSCEPNAKIVWTDNAEGQMVALRDIEPDEELRICYLDPSMGTEARQELLKERYGFHCDCPRCVPTSEVV